MSMSQPEVWMDNYETGHKSILKTDFLILCKRRPTTYKLEYKVHSTLRSFSFHGPVVYNYGLVVDTHFTNAKYTISTSRGRSSSTNNKVAWRQDDMMM